MINNFSHPCTVNDMLVGMRAGIIMDRFVAIGVMIIEMCSNVVVDSLIDVVTNTLADVFIDTCADILVEVGVSGVEIILVGNAAVTCEFVVPVLCFIDVLTGMAVGVLVDVLAGVSAGGMIGIVTGIGIVAVAEANVKVLAAVITVEIGM